MSRFAITPKSFRQLSGSTLVMAVIFTLVILAFVAIVFGRTTQDVQVTSRRINDQAAIRVAEAGIEKAVWCLNNPNNTTDCPGNPNYVGETNVTFGNGQYTSSISSGGISRTVTVTATVAGSGGTSTKNLQVTLTTTSATVSFQYGMQSGVGGLVMKNNNKITGNVFSNGDVVGTKSLITGDVVATVGQPAADAVSDPSVSPLFTTDLAKTSSTLWLAQSFIPSTNDKIYSLDLKLAKHGAPPSATVAIYSDSGGRPGSSLYSQTLTAPTDASGWENGWTNQPFAPTSSPQLAANMTYWLVINVSSAGNNNNYWRVVRDTSGTSYPAGTSMTSTNGTSWSATGYDSAFRVYLGGIPTKVSVGCTGSLCPDGNGIGGSVYAQTIDSTSIKQHACYQTISGTVTAGNGGETCTASSTAPSPCTSGNTTYNTGPYCHPNNPTLLPANFPLSSAQVSQMESQAAGGGTTTGSVTLSDNQTLGPKKIIGDLTITAGSSTPAKLTGTVWVQGIVHLNGTLKLDAGYGTSSGTIVADDPANPVTGGRIIIGSSGQLVGNSNANTYIMALAMSSSLSELAAAVDVSNNLTAGVVYAANGAVNIQNNANIKEVTGQKIIMQNNTQITYQTGLASVVFTSGPGASWIYQPGSYQIIQ